MSESQSSSATTSGSNGSLKKDFLRVMGKSSQIGTLVGWESIRRTLKREDDLADRDARAYHAALHGERGQPVDDDMGDFSNNLVLGDLNVNRKPPPGKLIKFAKAAMLGAALLGTGGLGGLAAWLLTKSEVTQPGPDTNNRYDIGTEPGGNW